MSRKKASKFKKHNRKRMLIQSLGALILNGDWKNFIDGTIYRGNLKYACLPVLNCYSCPGALGACPIGSLQAVANDPNFNFSFYVVGLLAFFGISLGRWFCGWLCPFGWIQELFYKIPLRKIKVPDKVHSVLRYLKFVFLAVFVFAIPVFVFDKFGIGYPAFCKWICPSGTLEAGIPLLLANKPLRQAMGAIFNWKIFLLIITIFGSVTIFRFFCKYACPLGALYGLFNKISFYNMECSSSCIECKACTRICKMNIEPYKNPNSVECIRCGDCVKVCPVNALHLGFKHENRQNMKQSEK